jgi:hypothetical protein
VDREELVIDRLVSNLRAQFEGEKNHAASLVASFASTSASILAEQNHGAQLLAELKSMEASVREEAATKRAYSDLLQKEIEMRMLLDQRILAEVQAAELLENERADQLEAHKVYHRTDLF